MALLVVGVGDGKVTKSRGDVLTTYALGSCIAVMVYDALAGVAGLLHLMLPDSKLDVVKAAERPWMFADSGLHELLSSAERLGAQRRRTNVWLAGGAQVLASNSLEIGKRNYQAVRKLLWKYGMMVRGEETGGKHSRTVRFDAGTGRIWIKSCAIEIGDTAGKGEFEWRLMS